MLHELTITVDDAVYQTLKPMVEQQTIGTLLYEFMQKHTKKKPIPSIRSLRGTLQRVDTSDIREESDRSL
jgi:predicted CopG family antitoxin